MSVKVSYDPARVTVTIGSPSASISTGPPTVREYVNSAPYRGVYEVTPTEETQTLQTSGCRMSGNVVVNPIPSNYGRIAYDGTTLLIT